MTDKKKAPGAVAAATEGPNENKRDDQQHTDSLLQRQASHLARRLGLGEGRARLIAALAFWRASR